MGETLARALGQRLLVASAYHYEPAVSPQAEVLAGIDNTHRYLGAEQALDEVLAEIAPGLIVDRHVLPATDTADALLAEAGRVGAAVICLGEDTHGTVSDAVLQHAACPVVIAPHEELLLPDRFSRIGVAYDGSVGSRLALAAAARLAARCGAVLHLIGVSLNPRDASPGRSAFAEKLAGAAQGLDGVEVSVDVRLGDPVGGLRAACEDLDLLACGSPAHNRLFSALIGSVTAGLIHPPVCPVLLAPPKARRDAGAPLGLRPASAHSFAAS